MSAARRSKAGAAGGSEQPAFEERLGRLESLVEELEGGELSLEAGVERYQEGVQLLEGLQKDLRGAEQRVEELTEVLRRGLNELEAEGLAAEDEASG